MLILRTKSFNRKYTVPTSTAKSIIEKSTGLANNSESQVLKEASESLSNLLGKKKVVSRGKRNVMTNLSYESKKPSKKIREPEIPGIYDNVEKKTKDEIKKNKNLKISSINTKHKRRGTIYGRTNSDDAWRKDIDTKGKSTIKILKKDEDLFGFDRSLTGINQATRDKNGKLLRVPRKIKEK